MKRYLAGTTLGFLMFVAGFIVGAWVAEGDAE